MNVCRPLLTITAALALSGCASLDPQFGRGASQLAEIEKLQERVDRIEERISGIQMEQTRLQKDMDTVNRNSQSAGVVSQSDIADLDRRIRALDAAREADRKAIVDDLSRRMADILNKTQGGETPAGSSGKSGAKTESGYEHIVKAGETLSQIASSYKISVKALLKANNLKDASKIQVGQKLFVPE